MENETKRVSHSDVLKALMNDSDKTATDISRELGLNRSYVTNTAARNNVRVETLATIAAAYGYDLALIDAISSSRRNRYKGRTRSQKKKKPP